MKRVASIVLIAIEATFVFILFSCKSDDSVGPIVEGFNPPTNLTALSKDQSVAIFWNSSTSASQAVFAGYKVVVKDINEITVLDSTVDKNILSMNVLNLINGGEYMFYVHSVKTGGDTSSSASIKWGPVQRYSSSKRIFEIDSDSLPGLQFSTGDRLEFQNGNQQKIDIWIDGSGNTPILLRTPSQVLLSTHGWRNTKFFPTSVSSMDVAVSFPDMNTFVTDSVVIALDRVYLAYTQDGHYARFQVTGSSGSYPNRYIDVLVSYNTEFGGWAKE